jgi:hypothetical protein
MAMFLWSSVRVFTICFTLSLFALTVARGPLALYRQRQSQAVKRAFRVLPMGGHRETRKVLRECEHAGSPKIQASIRTR